MRRSFSEVLWDELQAEIKILGRPEIIYLTPGELQQLAYEQGCTTPPTDFHGFPLGRFEGAVSPRTSYIARMLKPTGS